ncbi:MAG: hypothetical protein DI589_02100 [Shinella sp.]|nr:MAG: hypothetical protein DI589_02100 [Shinella sp.]
MPEAVASNSISVPEIQRAIEANFETFDETIHQLEALAAMTETFIDDHADTRQFSYGIGSLFRQVVTDFRETYGQLSNQSGVLQDAATHWMNTCLLFEKKRRLFFPQGDEVFYLLKDKLITIAENAFRDSGALINELAARKIASDYARQIIDRIGSEDDPVEAGSFLPWAELEILKDVGQRIADKQVPPMPEGEVRRTVNRLSASASDGVADEAREKIERAADAS